MFVQVICLKKEISVKIGGMHCGNCAKSIQRGLLELDGVEAAEASFAEENAKISFDPEKISLEEIKQELSELGYEVKGSETDGANLSQIASFEIGGMDSEEDVKEIQKALLGLPGIKKARVNVEEEKARVVFDAKQISLDDIEEELLEMGYEVEEVEENSASPLESTIPTKKAGKTTLKQGLVYGLVPHIGCIGFIVASILGVTIAVEFFKPLLMNPWFFHILILISIGFATISSAFYLRKNGVLSMAGIKRKKKYLSTMYGATIGINLVLFLAIFPLLANLDTGSFADSPTGAVALAGSENSGLADSMLRLQVNIPCPGHAPLISGELKTIEGVTGVRFDFPNFFDVAFDSDKASKEEILALEVFETYPASLVEESLAGEESENTALLQGIKEVEEVSAQPAQAGSSCGGSCGGSGSGSSCGGGSSCGCGG
jgi:copper ion binding protein